jgi:8-oxo-dGTP pyrophosphatase MutT (NUDIX family)
MFSIFRRMKDLYLTPDEVRSALAAARRVSLPVPQGYLRAAVLVPILFTPEGPELLFTKRTDLVETHKGQISFPGGVVDHNDAGIVHTAMREADEEVGIREEDVQVLGLLSDLETPTGFIITPVVGSVSPAVTIRPNADEVAEAFRVSLQLFKEPGRGRREDRLVRGVEREIWHYETGTHTIWGATAAIIRSLLDILPRQ